MRSRCGEILFNNFSTLSPEQFVVAQRKVQQTRKRNRSLGYNEVDASVDGPCLNTQGPLPEYYDDNTPPQVYHDTRFSHGPKLARALREKQQDAEMIAELNYYIYYGWVLPTDDNQL